mmetsp:Transcript_79480/g.246839  ORF Transcript_79480/g.246839 Transcript_79480/m.246839 type:complete len:642 (-) Transcript_79480:37-1962(-)
MAAPCASHVVMRPCSCSSFAAAAASSLAWHSTGPLRLRSKASRRCRTAATCCAWAALTASSSLADLAWASSRVLDRPACRSASSLSNPSSIPRRSLRETCCACNETPSCATAAWAFLAPSSASVICASLAERRLAICSSFARVAARSSPWVSARRPRAFSVRSTRSANELCDARVTLTASISFACANWAFRRPSASATDLLAASRTLPSSEPMRSFTEVSCVESAAASLVPARCAVCRLPAALAAEALCSSQVRRRPCSSLSLATAAARSRAWPSSELPRALSMVPTRSLAASWRVSRTASNSLTCLACAAFKDSMSLAVLPTASSMMPSKRSNRSHINSCRESCTPLSSRRPATACLSSRSGAPWRSQAARRTCSCSTRAWSARRASESPRWPTRRSRSSCRDACRASWACCFAWLLRSCSRCSRAATASWRWLSAASRLAASSPARRSSVASWTLRRAASSSCAHLRPASPMKASRRCKRSRSEGCAVQSGPSGAAVVFSNSSERAEPSHPKTSFSRWMSALHVSVLSKTLLNAAILFESWLRRSRSNPARRSLKVAWAWTTLFESWATRSTSSSRSRSAVTFCRESFRSTSCCRSYRSTALSSRALGSGSGSKPRNCLRSSSSSLPCPNTSFSRSRTL